MGGVHCAEQVRITYAGYEAFGDAHAMITDPFRSTLCCNRPGARRLPPKSSATMRDAGGESPYAFFQAKTPERVITHVWRT